MELIMLQSADAVVTAAPLLDWYASRNDLLNGLHVHIPKALHNSTIGASQNTRKCASCDCEQAFIIGPQRTYCAECGGDVEQTSVDKQAGCCVA